MVGRAGGEEGVVHTKGRTELYSAEGKSRLEDVVLNRQILLKWILKYRMGGSGPDWTHSADGGGCQRVRSPGLRHCNVSQMDAKLSQIGPAYGLTLVYIYILIVSVKTSYNPNQL
jgi:hypothetical protein